MPFTNFQNGATSFGIPQFGGGPWLGVPNPATPGKVLFVDGTNGSDEFDGTAEHPVQTIQQAVDLSTSGAGDVILVYPGTYVETVTVTSKDYVTIMGVRSGYGRPDVEPASGRALFVDNSQGVVVRSLRFRARASAVAVRQEGNGFLYEDCVFDGRTGDSGLLQLVGDATDDSFTASEGAVVNCLFRDGNTDALIMQHADAPNGVGTTHNQILYNRFIDNTGDDIATAAGASGGGAGICQDVVIYGNQFVSIDKAVYLDMDQASFAGGDAATNSGLISGNYFGDDAALDATKIDISGTSFRFVGNYNAIGVVDGSTFDD